MKVLIAPDKFKGSLNSADVAAAIARGIQQAWPEAELLTKPIADGGEGFSQALAQRTQSLCLHDALGRKVTGDYGWLDDATAVIEMSAASGLWRIAQDERNPLHSCTIGTGELIADAMACGAHDILVGLGGSATNDAGVGMAAALGFHFLDANGEDIEPVPANFFQIASIKCPVPRNFPRMIAACDVDNPLLGAKGATRVYGSQKGASAEDLDFLENALEHLADIMARDVGHDFRMVPGAGAAGGLGFGLMSFCGAEIRSGFELVAEFVRLEEAIAASDLVITGEGKIDVQTLHGKGPAGVAALARKHEKPVIAFAGVNDLAENAGGFDGVYAIAKPGVSIEESIKNAASLLESAAHDVVKKIRSREILLPFEL